MFDSGMILKGEIRCPSVLGIKGSKDNDITYIPGCSRTNCLLHQVRAEDTCLKQDSKRSRILTGGKRYDFAHIISVCMLSDYVCYHSYRA